MTKLAWAVFGTLAGLAVLVASGAPGQAAELPADVVRQLPPGYLVLSTATTPLGYTLVALGLEGHDERSATESAAARPLLLFKGRSGGRYRQVGRNDRVVARADEAFQCDPFLDGGGVIRVEGRFFTVENGVACGQHWTDQITFRFDAARGGYVFDHERLDSYDPLNGVMEGTHPIVRRGSRSSPVPFSAWRPRR